MRPSPAWILALTLAVIGAACGGAAEPMRPLPVPNAAGARDAALRGAGRQIYRALSRGRPADLLLDDLGMRAVLRPESASRFGALRAADGARLGVTAQDFAPLTETQYAGICLQGSRLEPGSGSLGLLADGWVFDRALVVGTRPGGRRLASWVEGTFVYTPEGFRAIALASVEIPRWEHADLELASCDMEAGLATHKM